MDDAPGDLAIDDVRRSMKSDTELAGIARPKELIRCVGASRHLAPIDPPHAALPNVGLSPIDPGLRSGA